MGKMVWMGAVIVLAAGVTIGRGFNKIADRWDWAGDLRNSRGWMTVAYGAGMAVVGGLLFQMRRMT